MLLWLRREIVALAGEIGAALTVLAQIANARPMLPWLTELLRQWREAEVWLVGLPLAALGLEPHAHIVAALAAAGFMAMIGAGARVSRRLAGNPLPPLGQSFRWFEDMSWPSLIIFALLTMAFLFGQQADPAGSAPVTLFGSQYLGRYGYAIIAAAGYWAGDYIGHHDFHLRLYRLAALVAGALIVEAFMHWIL